MNKSILAKPASQARSIFPRLGFFGASGKLAIFDSRTSFGRGF
jgi:hypothetical protein